MVNLYDLNYKGSVSCFNFKLKDEKAVASVHMVMTLRRCLKK